MPARPLTLHEREEIRAGIERRAYQGGKRDRCGTYYGEKAHQGAVVHMPSNVMTSLSVPYQRWRHSARCRLRGKQNAGLGRLRNHAEPAFRGGIGRRGGVVVGG